MLTIDGSVGEGGGQILRSSLALSLCLTRPFRLHNIRVARKRPGLQPQHLVAVHAAAEVGNAQVEGATPGSRELTFIPQRITAGAFRFAIGTAGSTTLVLQTVLPALCLAESPSHVVLEGGTHNPFAPPFDFLALAFLPIIRRMGPMVNATLQRPGFYPVGGGVMDVQINPVKHLTPIDLLERGAIRTQYACAMLSKLPEHIAQRELTVIGDRLGMLPESLKVRHITSARGQGNVVNIVIESDHITEVFTAFGERGVRAETVASKVVEQARHYLAAAVPVGKYLADQLLLPFALAGGGSFLTLRPSLHTTTNMMILQKFLETDIRQEQIDTDKWRISLNAD
jgi:RNA 3'-terminal phosphate cyclase (ATP)